MTVVASINIGGVTIQSDGSILIFGFAPTFTGAKFGSATDYTQFEADGTMVAAGAATTFLDQLGDSLSLQNSGAGIAINATENTQDFPHTTTYNANPALADYLYGNFQLNHNRKAGTKIYPHIHFFQAKDYMPNFLLEYRWQVNGKEKTASWTKLICVSEAFDYSALLPGGGTLHQIAYTSGIDAPSPDSLSDILQLRIFRDNANTSLSFTGTCPYNTGGNATVGVIAVDVHYECDTLGSRSEYVK